MPASRLSGAPGILQLSSPLKERHLPGDGVQTAQFNSLLAEKELRLLAEWLGGHPKVELRAYGGYDGSWTDLEFLRFFPDVRRVSIDNRYTLESIDGIRFLSDQLESLTLGATRRTQSLAPLTRFAALRSLYVEGRVRDTDAIGELRALEHLTLRSITLPKLELLRPLSRLRTLDIKLGGTKDLRPLGDIGTIEYLELWMVKGLEDLSPISRLTSLRYLFLQALSRVAALPDFSRCERLERVHIEKLKSLSDLTPLLTARGLVDLAFVDMPQLRWEHVACLREHPTLTGMSLGTGSARRNAELSDGLGLGPVPGLSPELVLLRSGDLDSVAD
jgi:hypothetical protein